jgi:hypothetical protein
VGIKIKENEMRFKKKDRGFYILSESWYAEANYPIMRKMHDGYVDDICFGIYPENGNEGTDGEMKMVWRTIGESTKPTVQLQCFNGSFAVLDSFSDVIQKLGKIDKKDLTVSEFAKILKSCGFQDLTSRER